MFCADNAVQVGRGLILCIAVTHNVLHPMDDLNRRVYVILGVPENDLVVISGQHQSFLVCIGHVSSDRHKGLSDYVSSGLNSFRRCQLIVGTLFQILDRIRNFRLSHVYKGVYVLCGILNVQGHRVAGCFGIITALIAISKLAAGLGVEGLSRTCRCAALCIRSNGRSVF